jgi:CRP-like cAMP-binding protein
MGAKEFISAIAREKTLARLASATLYYQLQQTARNVYCMRHHEIVARLARWLLMAMDRHAQRHFTLTHKFLAGMLGTRRAGVTVAASVLQHKGVIRYRRGEMEVLDRKRLEAMSCSCYAYTQSAQRTIFRP